MPSEQATSRDDYRARLRYGASDPLPIQAGEVAWNGSQRITLGQLLGAAVSLFVTCFAFGFIWFSIVHLAALARGF